MPRFPAIGLAAAASLTAFEYAPLPDDNLIRNAWFRTGCNSSDANWEKNLTADGLSWGGSKKPQNPSDTNCLGDWTGFGARWADQNSDEPFSPNQDALLWQVMGPVDPGQTFLRTKFLWVVHRLNTFRARIYGGLSASGPWTVAWTVIDTAYTVKNLRFDCSGGLQNRDCWWDSVSNARFRGDQAASLALSSGFPYYKVEFLANYPDPDGSATGDVGMKLTRVYFSAGSEPVSIRAGAALSGVGGRIPGLALFLDARGRLRLGRAEGNSPRRTELRLPVR